MRLACWWLVLGCLAPLAAAPAPWTFQADFDDTLDGHGSGGAIKPLEVAGQVAYAEGRFGRALVCGGAAASVKYPVAGQVRPSQGTVMMWVKPLDWPADEQAFHVFFETAGPGWLVLYKFWTGGLLFLSGTTRESFVSAWWEAGKLTGGQWHHLAGVWSREQLVCYVDGVARQRHVLPSRPQSLSGWFRIGDDGWGKPHTSRTLVDQVRIARWALPAEQIAKAARGETIDYQPPLPVTIEPRAASGRWLVDVDTSGYLPAGAPGRVLVEASAAGRTARAVATPGADDQALADLDIRDLPAGPATVRATVRDGQGAVTGQRELPFEKPADPPWFTTHEGAEDVVLPPYPPVRAAGDTVECWGRRYALGGLLPRQVRSAGQDLLAGPPTLSVGAAGRALPLREEPGRLVSASATRAQWSASATLPGLRVQSTQTIEYDGLDWCELTVTPAQPLDLDDLTLRVPLRAEVVQYLHRCGRNWLENEAGALPATGWSSPSFTPYVWLGDHDRGLGWCAEWNRGWSNAPGQPVYQVTRDGGQVVLTVRFINQPTRLAAPLHLEFGCQATPLKPVPAKARGWRLGNLGTGDVVRAPNAGNLQVVWGNGNTKHYGYPAPQDPAAFTETVRLLHARGARVIPYVNLNFFASDAAEWRYYGPDFVDPGRSFDGGDVGQMGGPLIGACPQVPAWCDLIAWKLARFVEDYQVDGIYVDCWNPSACLVEHHGCGWRDGAGQLHPRYPLRAYREVMRRARAVLSRRRPEAHILAHMSTTVCGPMLSFADSMLDGEQYNPAAVKLTDDYQAIVPLAKWRCENTVGPWGVHPFFLPEFSGAWRNQPVGTERLMGLMLAHDTQPWPIWCQAKVIEDTWRRLDTFGIVDAEFRPYWRPNGLRADSDSVLVSVYVRPGRALLVVLNTSQAERRAILSLDRAALGLPASGSASALDDGPPPGLADSRLTVVVAPRSYRLVVVGR